MESNEDISSRPSVGFPLGLALLVLMLVCMSGFFSCCVHWDHLRSLLFSSRHAHHDVESPTSLPILKSKEEEGLLKMATVLMPGDEFPKFIAMACPCHPPLWEKVVLIQVHKPLTFHVMPIH